MLLIKNNMPSVAYNAYTLLTKNELKSIPTSKNQFFRDGLKNIDYDKYLDVLDQSGRDAEIHRPFIGQVAWNIFFTYRALYGRVVYLLNQGKVQDNIDVW